MILFSCLLFALIGTVSAIHSNLTIRSTPPGSGTNNGFFWTFSDDGTGTVIYNNLAGGEYSVQWTNAGTFVAGKGWNPGSNQ